MMRVAPPLSEEQIEEKERLMQDGFTNWTRRDLNNFVRGLEEFGRDDLRNVATFVDGKTEKEVGKYAVSFFRHYTEIKEWEKLMRRIEAGEARIMRRHELDAAINKKVTASSNPWTSLSIDYNCLGGTRGKTPFSVENDRHLICQHLPVPWQVGRSCSARCASRGASNSTGGSRRARRRSWASELNTSPN